MACTYEFTKPKKVSEPLPLESNDAKKGDSKEVFRVWIGNMDLQMNEWSLLQLLKKYSGLKGFEMVYHKSGPQQGQSKGFGFATYASRKEAEQAILGLNNLYVLGRRLLARWANEQSFYEKPAPAVFTTPMQEVEEEKKKTQKSESAIEAIERKLREMERNTASDGAQDNKNSGLHPLLQQARVKKEQDEARKKRLHPYKRSSRPHHRHHRR